MFWSSAFQHQLSCIVMPWREMFFAPSISTFLIGCLVFLFLHMTQLHARGNDESLQILCFRGDKTKTIFEICLSEFFHDCCIQIQWMMAEFNRNLEVSLYPTIFRDLIELFFLIFFKRQARFTQKHILGPLFFRNEPVYFTRFVNLQKKKKCYFSDAVYGNS